MKEIAQIRGLSLWIFFIPLVAINLCLFISINYDLFENTLLSVDQIGKTNFSIPYLLQFIYSSSRIYPQYLVFKPSMILTAILLFFY